jgi:hypothetical protein
MCSGIFQPLMTPEVFFVPLNANKSHDISLNHPTWLVFFSYIGINNPN